MRPRDANPVTYAGLYTAEQQHTAYSDIEPDDTEVEPQEAYDAAMKVITKRKWRVVDARPPQALPAGPAPRNVAIQASPARDGMIEAVARTPILGFRDDVVVRVRPTADGARIDVRSASRYGRHDLGTNAARVRASHRRNRHGAGDAGSRKRSRRRQPLSRRARARPPSDRCR